MIWILYKRPCKKISQSFFRLTVLLSILAPGIAVFSQPSKQLQPYIATNKLYTLRKPADWKVVETNEPSRLRVQVLAPNGESTVDFVWERNNQRRTNAVQQLLAYRQFLRKSWPNIAFTDVHASADKLRCAATARFTIGRSAMRGQYYFESSAQSLSVQGYYAPESSFSSKRVSLVNIMASMAFLKKDPKPERTTAQGESYRPQMSRRSAKDRSLSIIIPTDWDFMAAGGKVVTGSRKSAPGFIFTSLQGNPMVRNAPISSGVISTRYLNPEQTLKYVLQAFGHRNVRTSSSVRDAASERELTANTGARGDAHDIMAHWTSSQGLACVGVFKVINSLPSMTGLWSTMISGAWAPQKDAYLYLDALEQVASSFSINARYSKAYIQAGLQRLREMERETSNRINDLSREREKSLQDWEARQSAKEFSDSKWDDYRRGHSYWVSDIEGGKVYATDSWGTRDTVTNDYYEGRAYNYTNFEGSNPRYNESMREISSYELDRMDKR